jgi:hypothetical protein
MRTTPRAVAAVVLATACAASLSACTVAARDSTPEPSCACGTVADPNWTPPPVSPEKAAAAAEQYAGIRPMVAGGPIRLSTGGFFYLTTGEDGVALVDAVGGAVVAMVRPSRLPEDAGLTRSESDAEVEAGAYLVGLGIDRTELVATVEVVSVAAVSAYRVEYGTANGDARLIVLVNGSTGEVLAFLDAKGPLGGEAPLVGKKRAEALAIAAAEITGETVTSAEFAFDNDQWVWQIGLGVPSAADPEVFEHGAYVTVDAVSGLVTFVKDAR